MSREVEAVYKNGVLRLLEDPGLVEDQRVRVSICADEPPLADPRPYFTPDEWADALHHPPTHEAVRAALAKISGSLSGAVIASREER